MTTAAEPETFFDVTTVPPYPVITVDITPTPEGDRLLVDGLEIVPSCQPMTDAAVAAAADVIRSRHLRAARVAANVDGERWVLVVDEDGNRYPLPQQEQTRRRRPIWLMPLSVAAAVAMVAIGIGVWAWTRPAPAPAAAPPPTAIPAELPVLTIDAWSTHAIWATPREGDSNVVIDPASHNVITATKNEVVMIDREIGNVVARAPLMSSVTAGPELTTIDGVRSIVVATPNALVWWPATRLDAAAAKSLPLDPQHEVVLAGSSPLVVLPDQKAVVIVGGQWSRRTVPAGATAVRADGDTLVAVDERGQITTVTTSTVHPPAPVQLTAPDPTARAQFMGTSGNVLVLGWSYSTDKQHQVRETRVYDVTSGKVAATFVPTGSNAWEAGPGLATVSGTVIDTRTGAAVPISEKTWRTTTVTEAGAWGTAQGRAAHLSATGTVTYQENERATLPLATDGDRAYVPAVSGDQRLIYALPARTGE